MTLRLNGSTSGYVEIDAPATAGSNTLVLPTGNGSSGQYLQTNGSGTLSWAGAGKILQVSSVTKTDTFSTNSTSYTDITGLSVTITPISTSNKLFITGFVSLGPDYDACAILTININGTDVALADASSNRRRAHTGLSYWNATNPNYTIVPVPLQFLYSPSSTSAQTVKIQVMNGDTSGAYVFINRSSNDSNSEWMARTTSTLTVMEVAA